MSSPNGIRYEIIEENFPIKNPSFLLKPISGKENLIGLWPSWRQPRALGRKLRKGFSRLQKHNFYFKMGRTMIKKGFMPTRNYIKKYIEVSKLGRGWNRQDTAAIKLQAHCWSGQIQWSLKTSLKLPGAYKVIKSDGSSETERARLSRRVYVLITKILLKFWDNKLKFSGVFVNFVDVVLSQTSFTRYRVVRKQGRLGWVGPS